MPLDNTNGLEVLSLIIFIYRVHSEMDYTCGLYLIRSQIIIIVFKAAVTREK